MQPDPESMAGDGMQKARREAVALRADAEAYSPARFQQRAGAFGLGGVAMRLGWDLVLRADERVSDEKPHLLIVSSMCLAFSQLQPDRMAELLEQGKRHLEFACSLEDLQVERGGRVLLEERRHRGMSRA